MSNLNNPYSAPQQPGKFPGYGQPDTTKSWAPREVEFSDVFNYSFEIWKNNLGLLAGIVVLQVVISIVFWGAQQGIIFVMDQQGVPEIGAVLSLMTSLISNLVGMFLGIGLIQICLKLARGQHAEFGDLFGGGSVFLPALLMSILVGIVMVIGYAACIIPGIILTLFVWPFYYFIVDRKTSAFESIEAATKIARPNLLTSFLMMLTSFALSLLGMLALGVGLIFAAGLIGMMYAVAYLMMSSQLLPPQRY